MESLLNAAEITKLPQPNKMMIGFRGAHWVFVEPSLNFEWQQKQPHPSIIHSIVDVIAAFVSFFLGQ